MKKLILFIILISSIYANGIKHANSFDDAIQKGQKENKQVMLFVYSTYCPWCKKMERTTLSDDEVIKFVNDKFIFVALNQDQDYIPEKFRPYGVPTTYVIDSKNVEKLYTMKGFKQKSSFLDRINRD